MGDDGIMTVIVGAGGHARVVAEAMAPGRLAGHIAPVGTVQPEVGLGAWLGDDTQIHVLHETGHEFAIGRGFVDRSTSIRRASLLRRLAGVRLATVVHRGALVSPSASLEQGCFVAAGAVVGTAVQLGWASIVNTGAVLDHDCRLGVNVHVAPGAVLSGSVEIGDDTLVGVGASIRQGVAIGNRVVIGAGAVVVGDVPDDTTALGVPARLVRP